MTRKEPRRVPARFDRCLANLKRGASSAGTSIPSESLNPTARFFPSPMVQSTLIDRPLLLDLLGTAGLVELRHAEEPFDLDFDEWFDRGLTPEPLAGGRIAVHSWRSLVAGRRP